MILKKMICLKIQDLTLQQDSGRQRWYAAKVAPEAFNNVMAHNKLK